MARGILLLREGARYRRRRLERVCFESIDLILDYFLFQIDIADSLPASRKREL